MSENNHNESKPRSVKHLRRAVIALGSACVLLSGVVAMGAAERTDTATTLNTVEAEELSQTASTASQIYENACQQVVGITSEITVNNIFGQNSATYAVAGSGLIITEDGYIMTNYHVIEDAYQGGYQVSVLTYDEQEYDAEIVGFDEENDIAVLKIDATGLNAATLGDSDSLVVGEPIYTVGNPLGELTFTMTSGIVSATDRTIHIESDVAIDMFQIDAAVNSGNSGGPVYNEDGQVIGIVTAKYASTGVEGLGFAIPINDAASIAEQLIDTGTVVSDKASLGITCTAVTEDVAQTYNMTVGAFVNSVNEGSAAEAAGLQASDIITAVDGTEVTSSSDLAALVAEYKAGDTAELTVVRNGEEMTLTVTFDAKETGTDAQTESADADTADEQTQSADGAADQTVPEQQQPQGGMFNYGNQDVQGFGFGY